MGDNRIGVFGGAFDPPHNGHLAVARTAVEQLDLDCLLLVVAGQSPLKQPAVAAAPERLAMAGLLAEHLDRAEVCDIEVSRNGPSYTVDTLRELRQRVPAREWWLIIGADQFIDFDRWREPDAVLQLANLAIVPRGEHAPAVPELIRKIEVETGICYDTHENGQEWTVERRDDHRATTRIRLLQMTPLSISSTAVRAAIAAGASADRFVPPEIAEWIAEHHLYGAPSSPKPNSLPEHSRNR